jgi:hypothetical protein
VKGALFRTELYEPNAGSTALGGISGLKMVPYCVALEALTL